MGSLIDIAKRTWANETFRMLFIAAGIMICFVYFGIMQEKIMRGCFGGELVEGKCVDGGKLSFALSSNAILICFGNYFLEKYEFEITLVGILALWYAIFARSK